MTPVPKTIHVGGVGNTCEKGGYCPQTTKYPLPCPPGQYQELSGMQSNAACKDCLCGFYCDGSADLARTDIKDALTYLIPKLPSPYMSGPCDAGYFCTGAAKHARQEAAKAGWHAP